MTGKPGDDGVPGSPGMRGKPGETGEMGMKGDNGTMGPPGRMGAPGKMVSFYWVPGSLQLFKQHINVFSATDTRREIYCYKDLSGTSS